MPDSLSLSDWIIVGALALAVAGALVVGAIRALWLYNAPPLLRRTLLSLSVAGAALGVTGLVAGSEWVVMAGLGLAILPLGGWFVTRSIFYSGPPPGLLRGPKVLDAADDVLDSIAGTVAPRHDRSDEDDA